MSAITTGRRAVIAAAAALLLLATACSADGTGGVDPTGSAEAAGDETSPTEGASSAPGSLSARHGEGLPDPCELITADEVSSLTGHRMGECVVETEMSNEFQTVATFSSLDDLWPVVQVLVSQGVGQAEVQRESAEEWLGVTEDIQIAGLTDSYSAIGLYVAGDVGDLFLQVAWLTSDADDHTTEVSQIAETVASAMQ